VADNGIEHDDDASLVMSIGRSLSMRFLGCSPNTEKFFCTTFLYLFNRLTQKRAFWFLLSMSAQTLAVMSDPPRANARSSRLLQLTESVLQGLCSKCKSLEEVAILLVGQAI